MQSEVKPIMGQNLECSRHEMIQNTCKFHKITRNHTYVISIKIFFKKIKCITGFESSQTFAQQTKNTTVLFLGCDCAKRD